MFGSEKVNVLLATSADLDSPLDRDVREDDPTDLGTLKLSSDLVGDVDHFCPPAFLVCTGLDAQIGFPITCFAATFCLVSWEANIEPGGIGVVINPAAVLPGEGDCVGDLRGSLVLPTELSENTGGPSSSRWPVREAGAGVRPVSAARVAGRADRGKSRLPRRIPPALRRDDSPLDLVVDDGARDLDFFVAGGDVIRSKVSKIFRLVSWATGTIAVDVVAERSLYGALRLRGRWPLPSARLFAFVLDAGAAEPGRPIENHCAAAEPGAGFARTLDVLKPSDCAGTVSSATVASTTGILLLTAGPADSTALGGGSFGKASSDFASAFANEGRQLGKLTASAAGRWRLALDSTEVVPSRFCEPATDCRVLPRMQMSRM